MSNADHDIITQRYFFPRRQTTPDGMRVDVDHAELACFHAERGHDMTVLHFHGNGEVVADYVPGLVDELDALGANAFFAEYRGYGGSSGAPLWCCMQSATTSSTNRMPSATPVGPGRTPSSCSFPAATTTASFTATATTTSRGWETS